ncbi:MAG TPA: tRNA pseudouridine(55) synthase TruB [Thermoanaerobaculia bacterium]|nr:tRNA pseudouridine(55) synthase TruB [Thermoanaerobaculia bacterium]HUM29568.1 tRNA pseudouridine(55) synthase TruB [Thermoanaerobaculia bacterium]HXK67951.1 tRNA pseudouridine(55) synthase TruB [Thermoanaerobaculia bacterium]
MKINGLLLVNKTPGGTSHDVVDGARKIFRLKRVGHTGTLDPQAEGLMVLCLGRATKLQQFLTGMDKTYEGLVRFGHSTTTYDGEGDVTSDPVEFRPELEKLNHLASEYVGTFLQTPPPFSAKRYKGKRLYELARSGEAVPELFKEVTVHAFEFDRVDDNLGHFNIHCGSGTYLRTIAHELGQKIGCGAYLYHLKRLRIGPFHLSTALSLEELNGREDQLDGPHFIDLKKVRLPFAELKVDCLSGTKLLGGQRITYYDPDFKPEPREGTIQVVSPSGHLICIASYTLDGREMIALEPRVVVADRCD